MTAENSQQLVAYTAPPTSPPSAALGDRELEPTMVQWRIDGEFLQTDVSQEDALPVNDVAVADRDVLALRISEANPSTEMKLRVFDQLDDNNYPVSGDIGKAYECAFDGTGMCSVSFNEDGSAVVTIRPDEHNAAWARMSVVQAVYPTAEDVDMDESLTSYSVSWAVRNATG